MTGGAEPALGAREVLLRAALGSALGVAAGGAYVALGGGSARREWYLFAAVGLFLGGLTGLSGFVERLGAGRGPAAHAGLTLGLVAVSTAWGLASIVQAEWTRLALSAGPDAATRSVAPIVGYVVDDPLFFARLFAPLGAVVAAPGLVRLRGGGWRAQLAAAAATTATAVAVAEPGETRRFAAVLAPGLLATNAASAWAAHALARRWSWTEVTPEGT